jgi:hypothetical protein
MKITKVLSLISFLLTYPLFFIDWYVSRYWFGESLFNIWKVVADNKDIF